MNPPPDDFWIFPDNPAFDEKWKQLTLYLRAVAFKLGVPEAEIDDAVKDFLLWIQRSERWREYDPERGAYSTWLWIRFRGFWSDRRKRLSRMTPMENLHDIIDLLHATGSASVDGLDVTRQPATPVGEVCLQEQGSLVTKFLAALLGRLSEMERQVLEVYFLSHASEEMSSDEAAQLLGCAAPAARKRLSRALIQVNAFLKDFLSTGMKTLEEEHQQTIRVFCLSNPLRILSAAEGAKLLGCSEIRAQSRLSQAFLVLLEHWIGLNGPDTGAPL